MNKFIVTKQYKRFKEFCRACDCDRYIGLCYGQAGTGKTESARQYTKWQQITSYYNLNDHSRSIVIPSFSMKTLNSILYTPGNLKMAKHIVDEVKKAQRVFTFAKERYLYGSDIPAKVREENKNLAQLVIIDEAERLSAQTFELLREMYDEGNTNFIFIGMPGIERILQRYPQLYSRIGFVHQFKPLCKDEITFVLKNHLCRINSEIREKDFSDQETISSIIRITNGNFRLINRLMKQSFRIMKVNCMTTITKEIVEAARSCLLIGEK